MSSLRKFVVKHSNQEAFIEYFEKTWGGRKAIYWALSFRGNDKSITTTTSSIERYHGLMKARQLRTK